MSQSTSSPPDTAPLSPLTAVPWRRPSPRATLPATLDTLFGRDQDVAALAAALRSRSSRLLVLTGPGGVGKTRLAIAGAAEAAASFPDGVIFVPLAPIHDPALVAAAIARAAGMRDAGSQPTSGRLAEALAGRDLLLVLDNFEHLLPASGFVGELLAACSQLSILMTSRARPRLTGERDFRVHPLALPARRPSPSGDPSGPPATDSGIDVDAVSQAPAVQLFADRARAIDPAFRLSTDNALAVAEICQRIDGLPLAIELAAARTGVLPPAALLARLDARLPLLAGGPRDQPARLQTMRQAIAWSYDLLPLEDHSTFQCLAIFVGGFGLDAAQATCAASLDQVAALVDQSLLLRMPSDEEPRCAMLETIREFAVEELAHGDAASRIRDRHALWCLQLATTLEPDLFGGRGQVAALRRLEEELPNLRAAFAWFLETGKEETALRLAAAIVRFLVIRGHISEGRDWLETALARATEAPAPLRTWGLLGLTVCAMTQYDSRRAEEALAEALALVTTGHDPPGFVFARTIQAMQALMLGRFLEAAAFASEAEAAAVKIGDRWPAHIARHLHAKGELYAGNLDRAEAISRDLFEAAQDEEVYVLSSARHDGGTMRLLRGDHAGALALFARALRDFREVGELWNSAASLEGAAIAALGLDHAERAVSFLGAAAALRAWLRAPVLVPDRPAYERAITAARKALGERGFAEAWAAGEAATLDEAIANASELAAEASAEQDAQVRSTPIAGPQLTPREREVLALLVAGQTDPQIGATLSISPRTVEGHVASILAKLEAPSRTAAVAHAVRHDLVSQ